VRKFLIILCIAMAIPAFALADSRVTSFVTVVDYLAGSLRELKVLAATVRTSIGPAKEQLLLQGRAKLSKLAPIFEDAQAEAGRVEEEAVTERWRERADRFSDFLEAYKKIDELKELDPVYNELQDEFCGPRDLYRFSGDC
jgi:hypothetical protein